MLRSLHKVCKAAGLSPRTLHHYENMGLLQPSEVAPSGYRMYDEEAILRLQDILLFREMGFSLKEIKAILDAPDFDRSQIRAQQIELLTRKQAYLVRMLQSAREYQAGTSKMMKLSVFDTREQETYKEYVKRVWQK